MSLTPGSFSSLNGFQCSPLLVLILCLEVQRRGPPFQFSVVHRMVRLLLTPRKSRWNFITEGCSCLSPFFWLVQGSYNLNLVR